MFSTSNEPKHAERLPRAARTYGLNMNERNWCAHYAWLQSIGYRLRRRFEPDWVPSWINDEKKSELLCEDGQPLRHLDVTDAIRSKDGADVALKLIRPSDHPYEAEIGTYLSSEPLASDPRNHCIPIYDVIQVPEDQNAIIIVMPLLRKYDSPRFDTFGEVVEYFRQVFEGMQFMHEHNIAHRDCSGRNIMMEGKDLYPQGYHPVADNMKRDYSGKAKHFTRTQRPPKYYLIDFGLSRRYNPEDGPPLQLSILGGDKSVPEFQKDRGTPCNPFPTDIYYLGNMIREDFLMKKPGFEFMEPLVTDMIQDDPLKRPSMDDVVARFDQIRLHLSSWKLRSRVYNRKDNTVVGFFRSISHWTRRVGFIVRRIPPTPSTP